LDAAGGRNARLFSYAGERLLEDRVRRGIIGIGSRFGG
jgi:hypothetical protein